MENVIIIGGLLGYLSLGISLVCVACVVGFLRSTHNIQYVPLENPYAKIEDELEGDIQEELEKVGKKKQVAKSIDDAIMDEISESDVRF